MAPPPLLLMLLASQLFGKIGLIYQIWNSVVPMNKRSRNPRGIVSKKNTPLSLRGGIVLQCRLLWSFLPFSPFISRHLSGRVETHVHSLLLSISNVKDVPWVVTGCVPILVNSPIRSDGLAQWLCVLCGTGSASGDTMVTVPWPASARPFAQCDVPPALCTSRGFDDVTHCWKQGATSSWHGQKGWITEKLEGVKFLTINK